MSSPPTNKPDKRIDPLIDAYRQASELEAQVSGARPGAAMRAAVLAHARVVAQSATTAEPKLAQSVAVPEAVRATPAANESKPVWRMVAGVVLGLAGMWMYQLTRPFMSDEANVAVMTAPQSANVKAKAAESTAAAAAPVAAVPSVASTGAGARAAAAPTISATPAAPTQSETTVAIATPSKAATVARDASTRERASAANNVADAARIDTNVALAKVDAPAKLAERSVAAAQTAVAAAPVAPAAAAPTPAATSAIAEVATSEPLGETAVASAEIPKAARPSAAVRQGDVSTPDAALFSAIRAGSVNALRTALARGANINARDEAGRSALQMARERSDAEMVKALELAGAK